VGKNRGCSFTFERNGGIMNRPLLYITLFAFLLLTAGCSDEKPKNERKGLTGYVIETNYEKKALLVAESDKTARDGDYDAEWYFVNDDAILLDRKNNKVLLTDIEVGAEVETWAASPSLESYPAKTDLSKLVVADDVQHPHYPMLQKKAIQMALNFVKSLSDKADIFIVQDAVSTESEWIVRVFTFNAGQKHEISVHAETGEVKRIK
jgi:hypothetical protein